MIKKKTWVLGVILLVVMVSSMMAAEKIIILTDDRPPFEYKDASGKIVGVAADKVTCAMDKLKLVYEIQMVPWKRAQNTVKEGNAHGFFAASRNTDRDKYATISTVVADQYWNWYLLKGESLDPTDPTFKSKGKVTSWFGSNSLKWLKKNGYAISGNPKNASQLVKMLEAKRVHAIFGSNFTIEAELKKLGLTDKVKIIKGLHKPMGVYFSKKFLEKNPGFLEKFNKLVEGCK